MPKITAKHFYAGADIATGEEFQLQAGESREVSSEKFDQLKRDLPDRFDFAAGRQRGGSRGRHDEDDD